MAKVKQAPKKEVNYSSLINSFLKGSEYKNYHFAFEKPIDYKVSTGSLLFDLATDGGFGPGLIRFIGQFSGGKTSECLEVAKNFQKTVPKPFVLYINAEGRLNHEMLEKSGIDYNDETKFKVLPTNTLHVCFDTIRKCIMENMALPENERSQFLFVIDSMDALSSAADQDKNAKEATRVAGGAVVTSQFLKTMGLVINIQGHMCICISQRRDTIQASQYAPRSFKSHSGSGGHALDHHANWIFEFEGRYKKDKILKNEGSAYDDDKNPAIGHFCKMRIKKSPNDKNDILVSYPIRYGRSGDGNIWVSKELVEMMEKTGWYEQKGAWINFAESITEECKSEGIELPEKVQGQKALFQFIEENEKFRQFAYSRFKEVFSGV
jgi:RecA/RadA recombinase